MTETTSLASGSVNEILDGIANVQEFQDSECLSLSHYLDDLTIPDSRILLERSSSDEKVSTIKKKPKNYINTANNSSSININNNNNFASNNIIINTNNKMNLTESDFINHALSGGGGSGRVSRSNSSSALVVPNVPKV